MKCYELVRRYSKNNSYIDGDITKALEWIADILNDWFDSGVYSRDFEDLMCWVREEYRYTGTIYRGVTLLKEHMDIKKNFEQSFSYDWEIAKEFATNNKVSYGDSILEEVDKDLVSHVIIECYVENAGADLYRFSKDLEKLVDKYVEDKDASETIRAVLSYPKDEKEVLIYPIDFKGLKTTIKIHELS